MKAIIFCLSLLYALSCSGQDTAMVRRYNHQLRLIDSLKTFIATDLGLNVPSTFYTDWQEPTADSMFCFLYLSLADRVDKDTSLKIPRYFHDEALAIAAEKDLKARGYHTLLYKTAGMSNALLSRKLLSYPDEAIAFIIFHEVTHRNLQKDGNPIRYDWEESLCDVVADFALMKFAHKTHMIDSAIVAKQQRIFEEAYSYMNEKRNILDTMQQMGKQALFNTCTQVLNSMTADANQFQKDRMRYEVNNAYFLRMGDYATHYFTIKQMLGTQFDFKNIVARIPPSKKK